MSSGYTNAFASTAPVAPANALPHGGKGGCSGFPAISTRSYVGKGDFAEAECLYSNGRTEINPPRRVGLDYSCASILWVLGKNPNDAAAMSQRLGS